MSEPLAEPDVDPRIALLDALYADLQALGRRLDRVASAVTILAAATPDHLLTPEQCRRILELLER